MVVAFVLAYLIGSIQSGVLVSRALGRDVRLNDFPGGSGMVRQFGWRVGLLVVALDLLKGVVAAWLVRGLVADLAWYAVLFVVIGHCWPVFFGFNGGQGVAPFGGAALGLNPLVFLPSLLLGLVLMGAHKRFKLERLTGLRAVPSASLLALPLMVLLAWRLEGALLPMGLALLVLFFRGFQVLRMGR